MKKITFLFILSLFAFIGHSQVTIFEDSFEDYDNFIISGIGEWTLDDGDGLPTYGFQNNPFTNSGYTGSFIVFNPSATTTPLDTDPAWSARTGDKTINAFAGIPAQGGPSGNDDRLISPQITLGSSGNSLSFWAKAPTDEFGPETFNIEISTTGTDVSDFTAIESNLSPTAEEWEEFVVDLDNFAGEDVFISIHYVGSDAFSLIIDDFSVTATTLSNDSFEISELSHFYKAGQLNIQSSFDLDNVTLFNSLGQEVLTQNLDTNNAEINVSKLSTGLYIAKVSSGNQLKTFKFIKQ